MGPRTLSLGVNQPGHAAGYSPQSSVDVDNSRSISSSPHTSHGVVPKFLINHRANCTFNWSEVWSGCRNENWQWHLSTRRKPVPKQTINPIWPDLDSNPGHRGRKPEINELNYGTALHLSEETEEIHEERQNSQSLGRKHVTYRIRSKNAREVSCTSQVKFYLATNVYIYVHPFYKCIFIYFLYSVFFIRGSALRIHDPVITGFKILIYIVKRFSSKWRQQTTKWLLLLADPPHRRICTIYGKRVQRSNLSLCHHYLPPHPYDLPVFHSSVALYPFVGPWPLLQFRNLFYAEGRTPWTSDQPVARPLPTQDNTYTDIHALSGIRTHDPSVRESEDSSFLRPLGHCDRFACIYFFYFYLPRCSHTWELAPAFGA
jgi:hypothetical protein